MHGIVTVGCDACMFIVCVYYPSAESSGWKRKGVIPGLYDRVEMHSLNILGFVCRTFVMAFVS